MCLVAPIDCIIWLLQNGLALRGQDESETSTSKGNFLELLKFHVRGRAHLENIVLKNAPKNFQMTSPHVQKDIVNAIATKATKKIINDLGGDFLPYSWMRLAIKEQLAIVLRYVN
ncbi:Zinc finger MYM-type protein 1 [Linum grandiflorum]